ncbi:aminotransferase class III-fold pyridoxal phosphate-dependent enzyme [Ideonella livida]|nr:aminotransferase class III-fold pyridoxal phosphate-dependent enzyme [Ideonella livida]
MPITERPAEVFVRGEGAWLWDAQGRCYLDWLQGWAVNALGHCPPVLAQALQAQAGALLTPSPALHNQPSLALAERLCGLTGMHQAWFGSTGAEANEGAIKLARKWGRARRSGAWEIITFDNAFHGRTLATMAASGKPGWETMFTPQPAGFAKARWNDLDSVRALIGPQTVAVMLEPVQGEAGVRPATPDFLHGLRDLCDAHGLLLILDEVQTGCARLGTLFGFEHYGVRPDILTLGKGLGGGIPISALLASREASVFEPGDQGGTFGGHPLMCAGALAVLEELARPAFLAQVQARGTQLAEGLRALSAQHGLGGVRGAGLLWALELGDTRGPALVAAARQRGLLINAARPHCLRFMPRLNSSEGEISTGLDLLAQTLSGLPARAQAA